VGSIVNSNVPDDTAKEIQQRFAWLTPREREVLTLLVDGKTNKDAAEALRLSRRTVETHRGNILEKLRVRSNDELRALCARYWLPQAG
jgi:DNA-binding NarL/FixJ family response regulator